VTDITITKPSTAPDAIDVGAVADPSITNQYAVQLTGTVVPENADNKTVEWAVGTDPFTNAVSVVEGLVSVDPEKAQKKWPSGKTEVSVTINATADKGKIVKPYTVKVVNKNHVKKVEITNNAGAAVTTLPNQVIASTYNLGVKFTGTAGNLTGLDTSVTWKSHTPKIATVDDHGKVTAIEKGSASISVTSVADPTKSAIVTFEVVKPELSRVTLDKTGTIKMTAGDKLTLTATPSPSNTETLKWVWSTSTGDSSIVAVTANKNTASLEAKAEGTVTVTVYATTDKDDIDTKKRKSTSVSITVKAATDKPGKVTNVVATELVSTAGKPVKVEWKNNSDKVTTHYLVYVKKDGKVDYTSDYVVKAASSDTTYTTITSTKYAFTAGQTYQISVVGTKGNDPTDVDNYVLGTESDAVDFVY
jgi:uncharacterized lipoprotein YajG